VGLSAHEPDFLEVTMTTHTKHPQSTSEDTFGGADAVPTDDAPTPPAGFAPHKLGRGAPQPCKAVVQAAPQAAEEIRTATTYESTFGSLAPAAAPLADAIDFAAEWSAKRASAEAWRTYTRQQEDLAWRFALGELGALRPSFVAATTLDPTVTSQFSKVAQLFAPRSAAALKAAASKKATKAAKEAAQAAPPALPTTATPVTTK
jgi:hypothetical protein